MANDIRNNECVGGYHGYERNQVTILISVQHRYSFTFIMKMNPRNIFLGGMRDDSKLTKC